MGEALRWPTGLDRKPHEARGFYSVLAVATLIGLALNAPPVQRALHMTPIKALFWAAVINGVVAVPIMVIVMMMFHSKRVMGEFARGSGGLKVTGWLATVVMALACVGSLLTWKR